MVKRGYGQKKIPFPLFPFSPFPLLRRPQKKFEDGKKIGKKKKNMIDGYVYILMALPIKKKGQQGVQKKAGPYKKRTCMPLGGYFLPYSCSPL